MSDGPSKLDNTNAEPLDDIILGEDDADPPRPPPPPVLPSAPPVVKDRGSTRPAAGVPESVDRIKIDATRETRKRAKLTLRIPDDEVSRPQLPTTSPMGGVPVAQVVDPDATLELPVRTSPQSAARTALGIDRASEPGWTPYQPPVTVSVEGVDDVNGAANGGPATPRMTEPTAQRAREVLRLEESPPPNAYPAVEELPSDEGLLEERDSSPHPVSEEIPVDTDLSDDEAIPPPIDSEEIKLEEPDRVTDPGEAPEVEPEDLVSVESIPTPAPPPPPKGSVVTATSLMAGVPQAALPSPRSPSSPPLAELKSAEPETADVWPPSAGVTSPGPFPASPPVAHVVARGPAPAAAPAFNFAPPPLGALAPPPMVEAAAGRKKTRPWWEELFNDDYIRTMAKITDAQIGAEATFIEESLGCEAGAMILDLACGTGRHAVELARRGYQVCGFDLSLSMLARASDEAQERGAKINFVQGDMREMTFEETFDGVYCWNTSFGFFDEEKNAAVVAKVHRSLKKGGQFLLDVVNRDYLVRQAPSLAWFEGDGCICMDEMQVDFITSRMRVKRTLMMDDGRTKEIEYSIRVYALHELGKILHDSGFRVAEVSGRTGTPGVFFGCESPRTLILAEKR